MKLNVTFLFLIIFLIRCSSGDEKNNHSVSNKGIRQRGETVNLHREFEPNEKAFSFLIPEGWKISGGITRIHSHTSDYAVNANEEKLYLKLSSPDDNTTICWLPDNTFKSKLPYKTDNIKRATQASEINSNSLEEKQILSPKEYIMLIAVPFAHPHAQNIQILDIHPLKNLDLDFKQLSSLMNAGIEFNYSSAIITMLYLENGISYTEKMVCVIEDCRTNGARVWGNKETRYVRAETGKFQNMTPLLSRIWESVQLNSEWIEKEISCQAFNKSIGENNGIDISFIEQKFYDHKSFINTEINREIFIEF